MSRCYGTFRAIKRKLTIYGTAKPHAEFANKNAVALLCQVRGSWQSMAPLGHVELTKRCGTSTPIKRQLTIHGTSKPGGVKKTQKNFRKSKQNQKRKFILILIFVFVFILLFIWVFVFHFGFAFAFAFVFILFSIFVLIFVFAFVFVFISIFVFVTLMLLVFLLISFFLSLHV